MKAGLALKAVGNPCQDPQQDAGDGQPDCIGLERAEEGSSPLPEDGAKGEQQCSEERGQHVAKCRMPR